MKAARVAAVAVVIVLAGAPVFANSTAELLEVLATLHRLHEVIANIRGVTQDIQTKLQRVWPERALHPILTFIEPVESIEEEIRQLSCAWRFSVRMERLRLGIFGGMGFCKREWEDVMGTVPPTRSRDLEEYYDWSATRRLNAIGRHVSMNAQWTTQAAWLTQEALRGTLNPADELDPWGHPGYAQRLAALGAAQIGNLMVESGKLQAYDLELAQERLNERRRRGRMREALALFSYASLGQHHRMATPASPDHVLPEALQ